MLAFASVHGEQSGFWFGEDVSADQALELGAGSIPVTHSTTKAQVRDMIPKGGASAEITPPTRPGDQEGEIAQLAAADKLTDRVLCADR
ncbi:hypothetical protein [Actinomadura alba]|uniref:Uncharacterized protein n=1 Tax=Actinomadura alba TaxID=406431 RepID=A0ABR7LQ58_9ACTN|nr:hypothetical protein [Actinomadura alba]MBC6466528.1 hypothetical protein [Actinomadura alba]